MTKAHLIRRGKRDKWCSIKTDRCPKFKIVQVADKHSLKCSHANECIPKKPSLLQRVWRGVKRLWGYLARKNSEAIRIHNQVMTHMDERYRKNSYYIRFW